MCPSIRQFFLLFSEFCFTNNTALQILVYHLLPKSENLLGHLPRNRILGYWTWRRLAIPRKTKMFLAQKSLWRTERIWGCRNRDRMVGYEEIRSRKSLSACCVCVCGLYVFSNGNISIFMRAHGRKPVEGKILTIKVRNCMINGTSSQRRQENMSSRS